MDGPYYLIFRQETIMECSPYICFLIPLRYKCAEDYHNKHTKIALNRGDVHGVAVSHGNLGFLKFYNPLEYDLSVVYQAVEYELAKEIGDFGRTGIAMNKIGEP